jgi:dipeptidyl aminopeptidase/acylaminoacyl peptidase
MTVAPFGSWPSPLSARSLVEGVAGLSELRTDGRRLFWLESRPEEAGRTTLMCLDSDQADEPVELTPAPHNVRSRVHEYGGAAYSVSTNSVFFVDFAEQNLHEIDSTGSIRQITHSGSDVRFADFVLDGSRDRLIAVLEQHHADREPDNALAAVDLAAGTVTVLAEGHDFYAAPRLSAAGRLAFIAWDHPNMPWDGTILKTASFNGEGVLTDVAVVAGGVEESVLQPHWQADGSLLFLSDTNGFWNLYRYDDSGIYCVLEDGSDYADPPWVFGQTNYTAVDGDHVLITRHLDGGQELVLVNVLTTMATPFITDADPWQSFGSLCVLDSSLYFIGTYTRQSATIERYPLSGDPGETVRRSGGPSLDAASVSTGEAITFPTRDGFQAHAFFYPPANGNYEGDETERPPLLVISHGGPTSATSRSLSLRIQYYTTRGWSVLDVNYRGSTGFGRAYRQALNGRWGEIDVTDCEDGVRFLSRTGRVDPDRVAIRGGSAGGFTTLAALTSTDTFRAGASHYGIGDLQALASDTHKFESRYLDGLLGEPDALIERSPVHHLDRFNCPVIFFQGSEDKVVPPNQSQMMAAALRKKGIPVAYLEFQGEGHGFRVADNIVCATESEYAFFCRVFGIAPADELPPISIDNADNL